MNTARTQPTVPTLPDWPAIQAAELLQGSTVTEL
jgi:hypothetical protein